MDKKIVFFDIDGTLLDHDKQLPDATVEAIKALKANGHIPAIATGRAPFAIKEVAEKLDIHSFVCLNGQYAVHKDEPVYKNALNDQALAELVETAKKFQHPLVFMDEKGWVSNIEQHPDVTEAIGTLQMLDTLGFNPDLYKEEKIYQALLFCESHQETPYLEQFNQFDFVRWHDVSTDIIPKGGSKAVGIQKMMAKLGLDMGNAYAFGDGLNDVKMLQMIPHSVAMGNALPEVKRSAKYVTEAVDANGIASGLQKLGLI